MPGRRSGVARARSSKGAVGASAGVAGLGTFGSFTDTTSASTPVDTGIVDLNLGAVGATNRLTVAAVDIVPGDTMQRAFTLSGGTSTSPLGSVTLTSVASVTSALDTLDAAYLPLVVLEAAGVPLDPSFAEQKKIFQRCGGVFYRCRDGDEVRRFNRLLIDAGLIKGM